MPVRIARWRARGHLGGQRVTDAFISYKTADDANLASALQRGISRLGRRWNQLHALRVYRDRTDLSASSSLWTAIREVLDHTRFFVLIASPGSASSKWVDKEVKYWIQTKGVDNLLIVLASGEIHWSDSAKDFDWAKTTALSQQVFSGALPQQPLFLDLRAKDYAEETLDNASFEDVVAGLAAPMHGCDKSDLVGEHRRQRRRFSRLRSMIICLLIVLLVVSVGMSIGFLQQRDTARSERDLAIARDLSSKSALQIQENPRLGRLMAVAASDLATGSERETTDALLRRSIANPARHIFAAPSDQPIAVSSDKMAVGYEDGSVALFDLQSGKQLGLLQTDQGRVRIISFSRDGRKLGATSESPVVWDTSTLRRLPDGVLPHGEDRRVNIQNAGLDSSVHLRLRAFPGVTFEGHTAPVNAGSLSPDNQFLATASQDGTVRVWELRSGKEISRFEGHAASVSDVYFSDNGRWLVSQSEDGLARSWKVPALTKRSTSEGVSPLSTSAVSEHGDLQALSGPQITVWNQDGSLRSRLKVPSLDRYDEPSADLFTSDSARIVFSTRSSVGTLDISTGQIISHFSAVSSPVKAAAISPNNRLIAIAGSNSLILWNPGTGSIEGRYSSKMMPRATFDATGDRLAMTTGTNAIEVRQVTDGKIVATLHRAEYLETVHTFSTDGRFLVTSGLRTVTIWDLKTTRKTTLVGHSSTVFDARFAPGNNVLATASGDMTVRLWDVRTGQSIATLSGIHDDTVRHIRFGAGHSIISSGDEHALVSWDADALAEDLATTACEQAGGPLTPEERSQWDSTFGLLDPCRHYGT